MISDEELSENMCLRDPRNPMSEEDYPVMDNRLVTSEIIFNRIRRELLEQSATRTGKLANHLERNHQDEPATNG